MPHDGLDGVRTELGRLADHDKDLTGLMRAVDSYGHYAREAGVPPERALVALGALLNAGPLKSVSDWWRAVLRDRCVRQLVETYYAIDIAQARVTGSSDQGTPLAS